MDRLVVTPAARRDAVLELLRSARHTLILSLFRCDDLAIVDEVAAAVKRGVQVRVLITQRARGWKQRLQGLTVLLKSLGAGVHPYENPAMKYHAKYIVSDDGPALVTTLNFTRKCFENTFDHDCNRPRAPLPEITGRLIVGPDQARSRLTSLFETARTSIRIMDHRVTDPHILSVLNEKQRNGVFVQVIGDARMDGLIAHGRMTLIDEKTAIIGSIHLSPPSLDSRREVAILVEDAPIVTELYDYFQSLARNEANLMNLWASGVTAPQEDEDEEDDE